jgi:mRNA interferase RelE/StbE
MELIFSKNANKSLKKLSPKDNAKVRDKILVLLDLASKPDLPLSRELDIKLLRGNLQGFSRMRVGKLRVIFAIDIEQDQLLIDDIDFRGDIY